MGKLGHFSAQTYLFRALKAFVVFVKWPRAMTCRALISHAEAHSGTDVYLMSCQTSGTKDVKQKYLTKDGAMARIYDTVQLNPYQLAYIATSGWPGSPKTTRSNVGQACRAS